VSEEQPTTGTPRPTPSRRRLGLSGKLLLLTIPLVMIAEVLIYVPAIANFRMNRLNDRLAAANTAALVLDAAPSGMVPETLARQILTSIGARAVAIKMGQQRRLLASADLPPAIDHDVDMRTMTVWSAIVDSFEIMLESGDQAIRVIGAAPGGAQFIEVVIDEAPLRQAMYRFSSNLLLVSLVITILTTGLVYLALHYLFVRPMRRLTANLVGFHENPESSARIIVPSQRGDEIGVAERELSDMQRDLVSMLHQKSRLAALGLAVSKINHDLRNLLASSQLLSDQLASVPDPRVQRFAPKLMRSLERAIAFCPSTPIPTSCFASCSIWCATPRRRSKTTPIATSRPRRFASPDAARARSRSWRFPTPAPAFPPPPAITCSRHSRQQAGPVAAGLG
jgi:signal transduction histidine kinase